MILYCEIPPPEGGETPFVPSFRVTERMLEEFPDVVEDLDKKGLMYSFTALSKNDTSSMRGRGWEDTFATSDPKEAEKRYVRRDFYILVSMPTLIIRSDSSLQEMSPKNK